HVRAWFFGRSSRHAPSKMPSKIRIPQLRPNWVWRRTVQTVPSAITVSTVLAAIRAETRHNQGRAAHRDKTHPAESRSERKNQLDPQTPSGPSPERGPGRREP